MTPMQAGLELMGYGLAATFTALILFYGMIKILIKLFPEKSIE